LRVGANGRGGSTGVVHAADRDRDQLPERWDAYGEDTIGDAPTVDVAAKTGAQNRRLVQLAGDAEPGLKLPVIRPLCAFQWFVDTPQGGKHQYRETANAARSL
jgi:hypothetical protein